MKKEKLCMNCVYAELHINGGLEELWCCVDPDLRINNRPSNTAACRYFDYPQSEDI